jgi:hypothetical protein
MILKILLGLAIVVGIFLLVVARQPSQFRVVRGAVIPCPPTVVFPHVADLQKWQAWSPWAKLDPNSKISFDGPPNRVGSSFTWAGNDQVGEGRMTILESKPNELVRFRLDFEKPFKATNEAVFTFHPEGPGTAVEWSMSGTKNFLFKAVGLFMNRDKMVGSQFEDGLANLQAACETEK